MDDFEQMAAESSWKEFGWKESHARTMAMIRKDVPEDCYIEKASYEELARAFANAYRLLRIANDVCLPIKIFPFLGLFCDMYLEHLDRPTPAFHLITNKRTLKNQQKTDVF